VSGKQTSRVHFNEHVLKAILMAFLAWAHEQYHLHWFLIASSNIRQSRPNAIVFVSDIKIKAVFLGPKTIITLVDR
jgi:hypothetical protein